MTKKRVLIIGLDGFTWQLGHYFINNGIMPYLAELVKQGSHGNLNSVIPFETSPAWTSLQTGCHPGKNDVFAFHRYNRGQKKVCLNSYANIAMPTLWELASDAGKKVVSLNMPLTSPPPKVNGVIIPGLLCPNLSENTTHPPEAYAKYIKIHDDYLIVYADQSDTPEDFTERSIKTEKVRTVVAVKMLKEIDWDIFSVQMQSTDSMQHKLWWALEPDAQNKYPTEHQKALEFYRVCDKKIKEIIAAAGPEVLTLIVSDHGFCKLDNSFGINLWLRNNGYLSLKPEKKWHRIKGKVPPLKALAGTYGKLRGLLHNKNKSTLFCKVMNDHIRRHVDFDKTKAFCLGGMGGMLYINGTAEERRTLTKELTQKLMTEFGPDTQTPVISEVISGTDVYGQGNKNSLPDLVIKYQKGVEQRIAYTGKDIVIAQAPSCQNRGTHIQQGILVANGPGISSGTNIDASIVDITPTVLAYMGIPVPRHIDGIILNNAFVRELKALYYDLDTQKFSSVNYSDAEQFEVEKQLSDLGYL